ncbi:MAG: alpha/beta hydrolase [Kiloniellales bacterium]|nr:alpha/beta hydrolase [Kiloniellales bacterium]
MAYRVWGDQASARGIVVCVHGLTRNASDFDELASALSHDDWCVVCPDIVGRGESDWLHLSEGYALPQYASDLTALLAKLNTEDVHWIGTSMGGLIGLVLAATSGHPLRSLFLNDIGPFVPQSALAEILAYITDMPLYPDVPSAAEALRERYQSSGPLDDETWERVAVGSTRKVEGGYRLSYDPAIADPYAEVAKDDIDVWTLWDRITLPVFTLRGEISPILLKETADEMSRRGAESRLVECAGVGHAPWLKDEEQISIVRNWLDAQ